MHPHSRKDAAVQESDPLEFLQGGGEMGALMRGQDWSRSSLGPPSAWPQSLRTVVRLLLNTGHPMYVFWGADGACLYNDAYRASIGPERHPGSLGRPAREVWDEIWPIIGPQIEQVMTGGGATWNVNHLVPTTRHGRREEVYWTYSYSPIDDAHAVNGIGGVLVVCSETTEQVLAARRLTAERDRLAQLFEQAPTFMALLRGPTHVFEIVNPRYQQLTGHRVVIGTAVAEALPETVSQGYVRLLDEVFTTGRPYIATGARYATPAGSDQAERFLDFVYQPIRDADEVVTGIFVVGSDVTDRTAAELRSLEMSRQLTEAGRVKDEFLATLAHELRNPLAPIRSALDLIRLAPTDLHIVRSASDIMGRQLIRVVRLIDDLLDVSRVSRGVVRLQRQTVTLGALVSEAIETCRPSLDDARHALSVQVAEDVVLDVDPTRMVQVLANLLNNAVKFTPPGGRIALEAREDDGRVAITVRDTGIGIPAEHLDRVFDMFAQVDRSHAQMGGGLGIGLTLVRRLVDLHGGTVHAHSAGTGHGSEFIVRLPVGSAPRAADLDAPAPRTSARRPVTGVRILVADDNVDAATSLALMFGFVGHDARAVHDGTAALELARRFRPDVMVLDIAMPGLDGHALARLVRAEPWGTRVLLVAVSGWGQPENTRASYAAGFDHHLVKPVDFEVLDQIVREQVRLPG
ncbi:MAG: ATP-binding protein [Vicinamibacterales bacterium]